MKLPRRLLHCLLALLRFFAGVLLSQFLLGAVSLAGWGQEVSRRAALRRWQREAALDCPEDCTRWPSFLMSEGPPSPEAGWIRRKSQRLLGGAWRNVCKGVVCLLGTYCLSLPGMALWTFSWRYGWDNSFNKGYEQAYIGPTLGVSGILLFMLAMLYVPLAQVQLAVAGRAVSFFRWRIVRAVFMGNLMGVLLLAAAYALAALPINVLLAGVLFRFNDTIDSPTLTDAELLEQLKRYFLIVGAVGLPLYAWVRVTAGRVYARGFLHAVRTGTLCRSALLGMPALEQAHDAASTLATKKTWKTLRRGGATMVVVAMLLIWFVFVAQIYVRQFLNYVPMQGWLNQPLVHSLWLSYIPSHLEQGTETEPSPHDPIAAPPY